MGEFRLPSGRPEVEAFYHEDTGSLSYLVKDPDSPACAVIDPVMDYEPHGARSGFAFAERIAARIRERGLRLEWIIETHVHADHLSAAWYLRTGLGGRIGIGARVARVRELFSDIYGVPEDFLDAPFDHVFADDERYRIGNLEAVAWHTPGHTPACMTHLIGDAAFVGDTLFMPDAGTARADFPGGDAGMLYDSIQRILALPDETRVFVCHDYRPGGREVRWESRVVEQRANVHLAGVDRDGFIARRRAIDAGLDLPRLILPSIQVNLRAGRFPLDETGRPWLKLPVDRL
ncbi:MAG: hypothetical protein KatS3mg121_0123 [Gammaproteobacteria bacterium]|nr:MAG: hypothetical protein KatS3mg121_0123 [Gammaproteobacteria bacterium]